MSSARSWGLTLGILAAAASAATSAGASDLQIRGTLLCLPGGDFQRERPAYSACLTVVPPGHPEDAQLVSPGGFFQIRLPGYAVDQQILLHVYDGNQPVGFLREFVERRRVRTIEGQRTYTVRSYRLLSDCNALDCPPDSAVVYLEAIRSPAPAAGDDESRLASRSTLTVAGLTIAGAAVFVVAAGGSGSPDPPDTLLTVQVDTLAVTAATSENLAPGRWPSFARTGSSPTLGRTLTDERNPGEVALWNPAGLLPNPDAGIAVQIGGPREMRFAGSFGVPSVVSSSRSVVSLGYAVTTEEQRAALTLEDGTSVTTDLDYEEAIGVVGLGSALGDRFSVGLALEWYSQRFTAADSVIRITREYTSGRTEMETQTITHDETADQVDLDLSATWDIDSRNRVAVAAYRLFGSEAVRPGEEYLSLREVAVGYAHFHREWNLGAEVDWFDGSLGATAGVNWRPTRRFGLDLGGGTRYEVLQVGIDLCLAATTTNLRVRWDEFSRPAASVGFQYRRF